MADSLIVKLGADTSEFRGQVAAAGQAGKVAMDDIAGATTRTQGPLRELKRGFSDLRLLFAGGGMVAVLNFFSDLSERAQQSKDLIDANVDSARKWGDEWKSIKSAVMDFGVQALGVLARTGRGIADIFMAIEAGKKSLWAGDGFIAGFKKAWEEIQAGNKAEEETRRGLQQTLQTIEQIKKTQAARTAESKRTTDAEKEALRIAREQYAEERKRGDANERLAEFDHKAALAKMSDEERITQLLKDKLAVEAKIAAFTQFVKEGGVLTADGVETLLGLKNQQLDIEGQIAVATQNKVKGEKEVTEELQKQLGLIAGIRGGKQFNEASDESLREIIRRNRAGVERIGLGESGFGIGQDLEKARLQAEAQNAQRELDTREKYRTLLAGPGGEASARRSFAGDPLQFETFIAQIQNKGGSQPDKTAVRIATGVEELNSRLRVAGFTTNT